MTRRYAEGTEVSVEKSQGEIRALITKYGASHFAYLEGQDEAKVAFQVRDRRILFRVPLPDRESKAFKRSPGGRVAYTPEQSFKAWEAACRRQWRALALVIKAKHCVGSTSGGQVMLKHVWHTQRTLEGLTTVCRTCGVRWREDAGEWCSGVPADRSRSFSWVDSPAIEDNTEGK